MTQTTKDRVTHTPLPWTAERSTEKEYRYDIMGPKGLMGKNKETRPVLGQLYLIEGLGVGYTEENARLIVKAVNSHEKLIKELDDLLISLASENINLPPKTGYYYQRAKQTLKDIGE